MRIEEVIRILAAKTEQTVEMAQRNAKSRCGKCAVAPNRCLETSLTVPWLVRRRTSGRRHPQHSPDCVYDGIPALLRRHSGCSVNLLQTPDPDRIPQP